MSADEHPLVVSVDETLRRRAMISVGDKVLIGVSGGPDSLALLYILVALRHKWSSRLAVCHLNHGLRGGEADREAAFVKDLAESLKLPFYVNRWDVKSYSVAKGISVQEGARQLRYRFYAEAMTLFGAHKVALGHHADDNAESILMHLFRGTGPKGLSGIPPVRDGWVIRPMIDVTRRQIIRFLNEKGVGYVTDPSNRDPRYLRNRVRHQLMPVIERSFGFEAVFPLTRLAETMREEEDFWNRQLARVFRRATSARERGRIVLALKDLKDLHPALSKRCIRHAVSLVKGDLKRLEQKHVNLVYEFLNRADGVGGLDLPEGVRVSCHAEKVSFSASRAGEPGEFCHEIAEPGETIIKELGICVKLSVCRPEEIAGRLKSQPSTVAFCDLDAVSFPLTVRNRRPGDRFVPLGMNGSQKVKDLFINEKVSPCERRRTPLFWSGDRLIWVGGWRIHEAVKVRKDTKRVLKIELIARDTIDCSHL